MTSVSSEVRSVDPYMKNAFSSVVRFDISHKSGGQNAGRPGRAGDGGQAEVGMRAPPPPGEWERDVSVQVSTTKWLGQHGLRKNRLKMEHILPAIGFKLRDDYDSSVKRPVSSRYGQGLFQQIYGANGKTFNVTCGRQKLLQLRQRLAAAITLYRRRLDWLTSESRRVFGVVEERGVTVVLDVRSLSPQQFDQYRAALTRLIQEQFTHLTRFNLIRAAEDSERFSAECMLQSPDTLNSAVQWLWALDRLTPTSTTACAEAVMQAFSDPHNEAVYLFTEGTSIDCCRELLLEKVTGAQRKLPVHVVSFNCDSADTIKFLRNFCSTTGGRFHAYAVVMELDGFEPPPADPLTLRANLLLKRRTLGGVPPGAGVRGDVVQLFEELEEARTSLQQLDILIRRSPQPPGIGTGTEPSSEKREAEAGGGGEREEQYMSSRQWLAVHGLEARKLTPQDTLCGLAFRHQDGVVQILEKPHNHQTQAVGQERLINARYCERFPVLRWKDGRVLHVLVTPDVHRNYQQRMQGALTAFQKRIDWLQQGSRALFGTVVEEEIYIVLDTSASMHNHFQFVKERLFVLMQEQLRHKSKFNVVAFNSRVVAWRERLVEVSERSLQSAWAWVQTLSCWGSTNTKAALQAALNDPNTQAVYLLTDGRPDQPPQMILAQVELQSPVPVHTISFNCNDSDANHFLYELAQATQGRYHHYSQGAHDQQPLAWQSQDIRELREEMARGEEFLTQLAELRDQCTHLAWRKGAQELKTCSKGHLLPEEAGRVSAVPPLEPREIFRPNTPPRPSSAPPDSPRHTPTPPPRPASATGHRSSRRPRSARTQHRGKKLLAGHTRTSLMRTLNSSGRFSPNEWLLPETAGLFEQQSHRQRQLAEFSGKSEKQKKKRQQLLNEQEASIKAWLKRHGLAAKRLTLLDALAPTLVPHRAKYIPILDKHVLSRVFDEILPIAHVSGSGKQGMHLVNPRGVNLQRYEERLTHAILNIRKRLNSLVWNALPDSVKLEHEGTDPPSFSEHRGQWLQALSEAGWPVTEADIALLEREIERGEKFLRQSQDLRRAATLAADDAVSQNSSSHNALQNNAGRQDEDSAVDRDAPPTPRLPAPTPSNKDQETSSKKNAGNDGRHTRQPNCSSGKSRERGGGGKAHVIISVLRGTRVIARDDSDGMYYPGKVLRCPNARQATVQFDECRRQVRMLFVLPLGGAVPCPHLTAGDYALVQVVNLETAGECYVPAVVQFPPRGKQPQAQLYTLLLYNGQRVTTRRVHLVKISKERYELTARYIHATQDQDKTRRRSSSPGEVPSRPRSPTPSKGLATPPAPPAQPTPSPRQPSHSQPLDEDSPPCSLGNRQSQTEPCSPGNRQSQTELQRLQRQMEQVQQKQAQLRERLKGKSKELKETSKKLSDLEKLVEDRYREDKKISEHEEDKSETPDVKSIVTPKLLRLRRSLSPLEVTEEVVARFTDDGWYYRGTVVEVGGDDSYLVEDASRHLQQVWREDILCDLDTAPSLEAGLGVVARHPDYSSSYAPGRVVSVDDVMQTASIKFYDGAVAAVRLVEVYPLPSDKYDKYDKYQHDVLHIQRQQRQMLGRSVVAREDSTGRYYPGQVKGVEEGGKLVIGWSDGSRTTQLAVHVFSAGTRRPPLLVGDRVLALADPSTLAFLPGQIIGAGHQDLTVRFCDGQVRDDVSASLCYWVSQGYHEEAQYFWKIHQPDFKPSR